MVNKQNLWFVTLFSIILILSIFYVSMNEDEITSLVKTPESVVEDSTFVVNESTELVALRVASDEEELQTMNELKDIILSETANANEKNDAYNSLLAISSNKGLEQDVETFLKEEFSIETFVKINGNNVTVVVNKKDHNYEIANKIIRAVKQKIKEDKYVTVKFN